MVFLFVSETKSQFARDDPAFLVLLSLWLLGMAYVNNYSINTI